MSHAQISHVEGIGDPFWSHGYTANTLRFHWGEVTDSNELVYLRARYYLPTLGVFPSLAGDKVHHLIDSGVIVGGALIAAAVV